MAGKMAEPIVMAGGTPQEIMAGLAKLTRHDITKEEEYVLLKILYNLSKYATVPEFLDACENPSRNGVTRKQMDSIHSIVKILKSIVW